MTNLKHLGITLDSKMNWNSHIDSKCKELGQRLNILRKLPIYITPLTKLKIFTTFIRPVIEYGSVLYDNCTIHLSNRIENIQRHACIVITRCYKSTSNEKLLKILGLESTASRCKKACHLIFLNNE